jgi:hypothetical protein
MPTSSAIEYGPADSNHALATFSSCFPIHRKRETLLLVLQASGISVVRIRRRQNTKQSRQYYTTDTHVVLPTTKALQLDLPTCGGNFVVFDVNEH